MNNFGALNVVATNLNYTLACHTGQSFSLPEDVQQLHALAVALDRTAISERICDYQMLYRIHELLQATLDSLAVTIQTEPIRDDIEKRIDAISKRAFAARHGRVIFIR